MMSQAATVPAVPQQSRFASLPLSSWSFAIRIWLAMVLALYVGFWLQLSSASSAAVTVGVLALPTRGPVLVKATYRVIATCIGVAVAIAITGIFSQSRDLFVLIFAAWIGLCVLVSGFLGGFRAYAAVLSGYTVAIVAVFQLDSPKNVFMGGFDRGAAIVVGIASLTIVNDLLRIPNATNTLVGRLDGLRRRVATYPHASGNARMAAELLRDITALGTESGSFVAESHQGKPRAIAAKNLIVAMVNEIFAVRAAGANRIEDTDSARPSRTLGDPLGARDAMNKTSQALSDLRQSRFPRTQSRAPLFRSPEAAVRNAVRAAVIVAIAGVFWAVSGWPEASVGFGIVAVLVALGAPSPDHVAFAKGAVIAIMLSIAAAGLVLFVMLDGATEFPLLAIAMAPPIIGGALLLTHSNRTLSSLGMLFLVLFPVELGPANPQTYSPTTYIDISVLLLGAAVLLFVLLSVLFPTSHRHKRRWIFQSIRRDVKRALEGSPARYTPKEAAVRDADRIGQLLALGDKAAAASDKDLQTALALTDLATVVRRANRLMRDGAAGPHARDARAALIEANGLGLQASAGQLAASGGPDSDQRVALIGLLARAAQLLGQAEVSAFLSNEVSA